MGFQLFKIWDLLASILVTAGAMLISVRHSYVPEWKSLNTALLCKEIQTPKPPEFAMQETARLVSLLTMNVCSMSRVWVFRTLTLLWHPHQSFPETDNILVTGEATVPTDTVVGSGVFHPPAINKKEKKTVVE